MMMMRTGCFSIVLVVLVILCDASAEVINSGSYKYDAGIEKRNVVMSRLKSLFAASKTAEKKEEPCDALLEVAFVLDQTVSTQKVLRILSDNLRSIIGHIRQDFPESRFGVATFVDKSTHTFEGEEGYAWCLNTFNAIGSETDDIVKTVKDLIATGGADQPENVLGGMVRAALSTKLGYSTTKNTTTKDAKNALPLAKVMVVYSDAMPHSAEYFNRYRQISENAAVKQLLRDGKPLKFSEFVTREILAESGENAYCYETEYPSFAEWAEVMKAESIIPIIVTGGFSYEVNGRRYVPIEYQTFAKDMGNLTWSDMDSGLYNFWSSVFSKFDIHGLLIDIASEEEAYIGSELREELQKVRTLLCATD